MGRGAQKLNFDISEVQRFAIDEAIDDSDLQAVKKKKLLREMDELIKATTDTFHSDSVMKANALIALYFREGKSIVQMCKEDPSFVPYLRRSSGALAYSFAVHPDSEVNEENYIQAFRRKATEMKKITGAEKSTTPYVVIIPSSDPSQALLHLRNNAGDKKALCGQKLTNLLGKSQGRVKEADRGLWKMIWDKSAPKNGCNLCVGCNEELQKKIYLSQSPQAAAQEEFNFVSWVESHSIANALENGFYDALQNPAEHESVGDFSKHIHAYAIERAAVTLAIKSKPTSAIESRTLYNRIVETGSRLDSEDDVLMRLRMQSALKALKIDIDDIDWRMDDPKEWLIPVARDVVCANTLSPTRKMMMMAKVVFPEAIEMLQVTRGYPSSYSDLILP